MKKINIEKIDETVYAILSEKIDDLREEYSLSEIREDNENFYTPIYSPLAEQVNEVNLEHKIIGYKLLARKVDINKQILGEEYNCQL